MMIFIKEEKAFYLYEAKFGIGSRPIIKNEQEIIPLVIIWTHQCVGRQKSHRYSGKHTVLSSTTKLLSGAQWIEVDDRTDLEGSFNNFGSRQCVGEFSYDEIYLCPTLENHITKYDDHGITLDSGITLDHYDLSRKAIATIIDRYLSRQQRDHDRELIASREIYIDTSGLRRVNIGADSYPLEVPTGEINQYNVGDKRDSYSSSDPYLHAWLQAAEEVGVPARYAWHGIMSALGDHGSVSIPWKEKPHDHKRA